MRELINYESDEQYVQYLNYMDRYVDDRMDEWTHGITLNGCCELRQYDDATYESN